MAVAGIAIDAWKIKIFKRNLEADGYTFTEHPGPTPTTKFLKVETDNIHKLADTIRKATLECKMQ